MAAGRAWLLAVVWACITVTLEEVDIEEPDFVGKVADAFSNNPVLFVPVLMLIAAGVVVLLRTKNAMDLELDMEDEDKAEPDESGELENSEEHAENDVEDDGDDELEETDDEEIQPVEEKPVRTRRKSVRPNTSSDGPITTVKRRRLDSNIAQPKEISKRKTASKKKVVKEAPAKKKVKTRRVVTYADNEKEQQNVDD